MTIDTITFEELSRWVEVDDLTAVFGRRASDAPRGVLTAEWIGRLATPLEARGFRVDAAATPIHFWRNREQTGFVFAQ